MRKSFISLLLALIMCFTLVAPVTAFADSSTDSYKEIESKGTDVFNFSGSGTATFYDSAYISLYTSKAFPTVRITLSGNPSTQYRIYIVKPSGATATFYRYANGSSCSTTSLTSGTFYIRIDPYTGTTAWVTANITT